MWKNLLFFLIWEKFMLNKPHMNFIASSVNSSRIDGLSKPFSLLLTSHKSFTFMIQSHDSSIENETWELILCDNKSQHWLFLFFQYFLADSFEQICASNDSSRRVLWVDTSRVGSSQERENVFQLWWTWVTFCCTKGKLWSVWEIVSYGIFNYFYLFQYSIHG